LAIGDELLAGAHPDLNSPRISRALAEVGWRVYRVAVVGDRVDDITSRVLELCSDHDLVLVSGGLGPTLDDLTREAVARAAGLPLVEHADTVDQIRGWFEDRGREMPASNLRQALFPEGAEVLANKRGTAPGFTLAVGGTRLFVLPGPPREMEGVLLEEVVPRVRDDGATPSPRRRFFLTGLSESAFADAAGDWMGREAMPRMGVTAKMAVLCVHLTLDPPATEDALEERAAAFRERFGHWIFSESTPDLGQVVGELLLATGTEIALAESCTGGLVAAALTAVPGISRVFREGVVTYSDAAKISRLGVDPEVIDRCGAVSAEVAAAMAKGCARTADVPLGLSVTGIAGPGGGTPEKPVGLIWYGLHLWDQTGGQTRTFERRFPARGRAQVREFATQAALGLLWRVLQGSPEGGIDRADPISPAIDPPPGLR
jgi:nicotinamide-nucleotide amidase